MTRRLRRLGLLLLLVLSPVEAGAGSPHKLVWIHAEANEGGASGGHAALRIGDEVYHFQTIEGRTLLARWTWTRFRRLYNDLQNRTLHLVEQDLAAEALERIRHRFAAIYQRQRRQLARAEDLAFQRALLEAWVAKAAGTVPIRGLGLFGEREADRATPLLRAIRATHGETFLSDAIREIDRQLAEARLAEEDILFDPITQWRDAGSRAAAYRERMELREALRVLASGRSVDPERQIASDTAGTAPAERTWLARELRALEARIVRLVASARPDRGYALLLATARQHTLRRSLAEDRLFSLDPFPGDAPTIAAPRRPARRGVFEAMARRLDQEHRDFRAQLLGRELSEPDYRALEAIAAAHFEVRQSLATGRPIRTLRAIEAPARRGDAATQVPSALSPTSAEALHAASVRAERRYREFLDREHGYQLVQRNCATELLRSVQAGFPSAEAAAKALGGQLSAEAGTHFVPFRWLDAIEHRFADTRRTTLPAYRVREVRAMRERERSAWVSLRESNTWTSNVYVGAPTDSHFLFFADEHAALRPLFGALNFGYGALQSTLGLASWPWDGGERIDRGLRGAFFSLPELVFISLRKGTFEDVGRTDAAGR